MKKDDTGATVIDTTKVKYAIGTSITYPAVNDTTATNKGDLSQEVTDIEQNLAKDEKLYTAASWAALAKRLEEAHTVLDNADATQEQVDAALKALKNARAALVKVGDDVGSGNKPSDGNGSKPNDGKGNGKTPATGGKLPKTGDFTTAAVAATAATGIAAVGLGTAATYMNSNSSDDQL